MELIANLWWVWLCLFIGSVGAALVVQMMVFRSTVSTFSTGVSGVLKADNKSMARTVGDMIESVHSSFFSKIWKFVLITLLGWVSGILLFISVVIHIIKLFV